MMSANIREKAVQLFRAKTGNSEALSRLARGVLPSGTSSNVRYFDPYPIYVEKAKGETLWDVDGNKYVDCRLACGPAFLGHAPQIALRAGHRAARRGTVFAEGIGDGIG